MKLSYCGVVFALNSSCTYAQSIVNGQIYTPGIAIVDAPQPNTPLGGDYLQVALDVTSDGQLQLPPYPLSAVSEIFNITIFLSSYVTGRNFTISNGTASAGNASLGEIMQQEPTSTVKHVNWVWPDCLVGNGAPSDNSSSRGAYNISIRQNFRLNGTNRYTIFDLPIQVTNSIPTNTSLLARRPPCDSLNNPLLSDAALDASADSYTRIPGTAIQTGSNGGTAIGGNNTSSPSSGGLKAANVVEFQSTIYRTWAAIFALTLCLR